MAVDPIEYRWIVHAIASKAARRCECASEEDLLQDGFEALVRAANHFDGDRGTLFSTYAYRCVLRAIAHSVSVAIKTSARVECLENIEFGGEPDTVAKLERARAIACVDSSRSLSAKQLDIIRRRIQGDELAEIAYDHRMTVQGVHRSMMFGLKLLGLR
jgi:RNA polymerase sigma factor (sigma-70 family)